MSEHILQPGSPLPPFHSGSVLKSADAANLVSSAAVLAGARKFEEETKARLAVEVEEQRKAGYAQGLREGLLEARAHNLKTVAETNKAMGGLHARICETAVACLRTILSEMPPAERIARAATAAMETVNLQQTVVLCVHPSQLREAGPVSQSLSQLMSGGARVECRGREDVEPGDCLLETPLGIIRCSLRDQLAAVEKALLASED